MATVELIRAIGEDECHGCVAQVPNEEAEEVAGRLIGPVQILYDEYDRGSRSEALEHTEEQLEEASLG
jgi:hypothetical protein